MSEIEAALARLVAAYTAAGGTTEEFDPVDDADLDDLRRRVAPLRLPIEIEHVWRRFQELGVPGIIDTNSLASVETVIGAMGHTFQSRVLLSIGSGRARCYLELHDADGTGGGAVWTLREYEPEMYEVAPSLTALLDVTAAAWERGIARLSDKHPFPWAAWDEDGWDRLKADRLPTGRVAGSRPAGWLLRWLAVEGLTAVDVAPHGPTASITELLAADATWRETQTVRGRVTSLVGAETKAAVISDGTGELLVYVPDYADPFGLLTFDSEAELDVLRFSPGTEVHPLFDPSAFEALAVAIRDV